MTTSHEIVKAFMAKRGMGGYTKDDYGLRALSRKSGVPVSTLANYFNPPHYMGLQNMQMVCKTLGIDSAKKLRLLDGIVKGELPKEMYGDVMDDFQDQLDNIITDTRWTLPR